MRVGRIFQNEQEKIEVMAELVAYVDGGCLGNPGPSGIGVVINGCASGPVRIAKWIGRQDNNVAEYAALMEALQYAVSLQGAEAARVFGFGSRGPADDGGVHVPQPAALFAALDLPEAGALAEIFYFARAPRKQRRGERAGAVGAAAESCPKKRGPTSLAGRGKAHGARRRCRQRLSCGTFGLVPLRGKFLTARALRARLRVTYSL